MDMFENLPLFQQPQPTKLELQWEDCKRQNPWLLPKLAEMAIELKKCGFQTYSINGLFEALRWETRYSMNDIGLKVNNNHRAFAARELMKRFPELQDFFRTREQKPRPNNWGQLH